MADNIDVTPGVGKTIAADEIVGALHQRIKVVLGNDGISDGDISQTNPMPVYFPTSPTLPTDAATETTLADLDSKVFQVDTGNVTVIASALPSGAALSVKQPNFGTAGAPSVDVLTIQGIASMTPLLVNGSGFVQPVSGPLTDAQLRASPVPVSGTITTSPNVNVHDGAGTSITSTGSSLNVNVTNSVAVTGTFFQATQPVSGTLTVNQGTTPWLVDGSATTQPISAVALPLPSGASTAVNQATGNASLASIDSKLTSPISVAQSGTWNVGLSAGSNTIGKVDQGVGGASAWKVDGSAVIQPVNGTVTVNQGTSPWVVTATTTTANDTNYGTVGANTLRTASQIGNATGAALFGAGTTTAQVLRVVLPTDQTAIPVTQSGAWSVTANAGTNLNTSLLALDTTVSALQVAQGSATSGEHGTLVQGAVTTNAPSYTTAQTSPLSLDTSGLLRISLKDTPANTNKFLVTADPITFASPQHVIIDSGTAVVTQGTSPWVVSGTVAVSNLPTTVDTNYGAVSASTIRSAAQIGNATGAALFGAGTTTAQVLRVVLPTDQTAIPVNATLSAETTKVIGTVNQGTSPWITSASNFPTTVDTNYGTIGASSLRIAAQIGNATGAALFGAGTTTAQVLRVVLPTDQTAIPVTQSGSWSVTATQTADTAPATQNITIQDTASTTTAVANAQNFITGTPTANSAASFSISSVESVEVLVTGTWTGTLSSEVSMDGGVTWSTRGIKQAGASYISSTFTQNFSGGLNVAGMTNYRIRATAAMTGTATVRIATSLNQTSINVTNAIMLKDATTQSINSTVKAASTAAATTDTSLVVAVSPNSPQADAWSSITSGAKSSIGTSAVQITTTSVTCRRGVVVKAADGNTGIVYVGPSTITNGTTDATDGIELSASQAVVLDIDNANKVYVIGSTTGQKVYWIAD